jgi:hypothetical protein
MLERARSFSPDQLEVKCNGDPARDLVLHHEQVTGVAIEPFCPKMHIIPGID